MKSGSDTLNASGDLGPGASGLTNDSLKGSRTAAEVVSESAQASVTLVPRLTGMPSWYAPIQMSIAAAQGRSNTWLKSICPSVSLGLPQAIVDYNGTFQSKSATILSTLAAIGSGVPTSEQKTTISTAFQDLSSAAGTQAKTAAGTKKELTQYKSELVADVKALGDAVGILEQRLANGSQYVQKIKGIIGENFIDVESRLSPCNVIVMMNMDIEVKVTTTGAPQQAIAVVIAQDLVESVDGNVKNSLVPLQVVLDSWGTLQAKIAAVVSDLKSIDSDYANFLKQFDLRAAQTQWKELSEYASGLLPGER